MNKHWGKVWGAPLKSEQISQTGMEGNIYFFICFWLFQKVGKMSFLIKLLLLAQEGQFSVDSERATSKNNSSALPTSVYPHRGCGDMRNLKPHTW